MNILVTGATGFLGSQLVQLLQARGHKLYILSQRPEKARAQLQNSDRHLEAAESHLKKPPLVQEPPLKGQPVEASPAQTTTRTPAKNNLQFFRWPQGGQAFDPSLVNSIDHIIHLAGENIARRRWSQQQKQKIFNSRLLTTRQLVKSFNTPRLKTFICASAVGGYAPHPTHIYTEQDPLAAAQNSSPKAVDKKGVHPQISTNWPTKTPPQMPDASTTGVDFLARVVHAWEAELEPLTCRRVMLRTGLVLGQKGGALQLLQKLHPFYLNGALGRGSMWVSWVHEHDWLQAVLWLLDKPHLEGPFNLTSPQPVQQYQLARAINQALVQKKTNQLLNKWQSFQKAPSNKSNKNTLSTLCGAAEVLPRLYYASRRWQLPAPPLGVRLLLGEMSQLVLSSHRVRPEKLQHSAFQFQYPAIEDALNALIKT